MLLPRRLEVALTLARTGLVRPMRPDRGLRQGLALWRWGASPAAAFVAHGIGAPDQVAVADDEGELTYGEVDGRTNALARGLERLGVGEGDRVGLLCRNGRGFVEAVVACAKLGSDALLLNTSFAAGDLRSVVERDRPSAIVFDSELEPLVDQAELPTAVARVVSDAPARSQTSAATIPGLIENEVGSGLSPPDHESRIVILTSGTTGVPKGARIGQPEGVDPLAWLVQVVPLKARMPYVIAAPLFHAHGFGQLAAGTGLACKIVLSRRFDPEQTLALIERHRAEGVVAVPVMLKRMLDLPAATRRRYDTGSLRIVLSSGSALPAELAHGFIDEFGPVLYNLYGSTELSGATIATPRDLIDAPGTAGRALPHSRLVILDDSGRPVGAGETGRIFVQNELLFEGYTDGSVRDTVEGMMSAGDLGHLDEQGRLFVDSREDDMIVSGGENVYPSEVEAALAAHPDVDDVAAVGVEDAEFGQRTVAFVVPKPGTSLTEEAMREWAKQRLARYKVPRRVVLRDELPRNALGKILKRELREAAASQDG